MTFEADHPGQAVGEVRGASPLPLGQVVCAYLFYPTCSHEAYPNKILARDGDPGAAAAQPWSRATTICRRRAKPKGCSIFGHRDSRRSGRKTFDVLRHFAGCLACSP